MKAKDVIRMGRKRNSAASTAASAMLEVLQRCFPDRYQVWLPSLKDMVPSLGVKLSGEPALFEEVWSWGTKALGLHA
jgi:malate dehydrogenase (quinone)